MFKGSNIYDQHLLIEFDFWIPPTFEYCDCQRSHKYVLMLFIIFITEFTMSKHIETIALRGQEPGQPLDPERSHLSNHSFVFKDTEHATNLFGLKEFGNIYSRIMNLMSLKRCCT